MSGAMLGVKLAGIATKVSGVGAVFKKVPRWAWIAAAAVALLTGGYLFHQHRAHAAIAAAKAEQKAADDAAFAKRIAAVAAQATEIRKRAEALSASISNEERIKNDQAHARNAADADALRLRGPGAAASNCRPVDHPAAPAASSGHSQAAATSPAPRPGMPANDWATVPWQWLVTVVKEHDDLLADEVTTRAADAQQRAAWEKMRSKTSSDYRDRYAQPGR